MDKFKGLIKYFMIVILILFAFGGITVFFANRTYNAYETIAEIAITDAQSVEYLPYMNLLLKYSKDGASCIDANGEAIWTESFVMKMPKADVSGNYAAIADLNGNEVYIFNDKGKVNNIPMPYKISDIAVAAQGVFVVILEGEKENYINLYDRTGDKISERQTTIDKSGYPMDIAISDDGKKLFTSYMHLEGVVVKNSLAAYNFGSVGQNENADRLVGGYPFDSTIIPKVEFLDNNTVCAFSDDRFIIYAMKEKSSEKAIINFSSEIKSVVFNKKYVGAVFENDVKESKIDGKYEYVLEIYNTNGNKVLSQGIDFEYDNIYMSDSEIIITGGAEVRIYTLKGKMKFNATLAKNVINLIPNGNSNKYILLYESGAELIRLKYETEENESKK